MKLRIAAMLLAAVVLAGCGAGGGDGKAEEPTGTPAVTAAVEPTENIDLEEEKNMSENSVKVLMEWPSDRAFPLFKPAEGVAYTVLTSNLSQDERITMSAFQGVINASSPRILLMESGDIPANTWADTFGVTREDYSNKTNKTNKPIELIAKFKDEIRGLVVYSNKRSLHYRNAAATVANGMGGYLPVTEEVKEELAAGGVEFGEGNIIDITGWEEETPLAIYGRVYDEYWKLCSKRLIVSANPLHDLDHARDMAAAANAAVVYLDCTDAKERALYQKFIKDMADNPDTAIAMGWFTTERSGITAGSEFGVSTVPADLYISSTYYAGVGGNSDAADLSVNVPQTPKRAALENKVYIAVYMTDGDNVQYVQRYMRKLWDSREEQANRGVVPINWTISPSLADIGPGILNYYYANSTDKECFVSGPSGMGYLMPTNTLYEKGAKVADFLTDKKYMDNYTKLTETYLRKSGIRAITIWDDASPDLREAFARNCRYLYGATVQNFGDGSVFGGVADGKLYFAKHLTHYEGMTQTIYDSMRREILLWKGDEPRFLSYQVKVWGNDDGSFTHTAQLIKMYDDLKAEFGDVEFVRADHFFSLYNEANGMAFNLCLNETTAETRDGDAATFDFGGVYDVSRYAVTGIKTSADYTIETSEDGKNWAVAAQITAVGYADEDIKPTAARYVRVTGGDAGVVIEIYGARK